MKAALDDFLTVAGLFRPAWGLSVEYDGQVDLLSLTCCRDGTRDECRLAICQSHGAWMEWLG